MKSYAVLFALFGTYVVLQLIFDSVWILVGLIVVFAFCLGFYASIRSTAAAIKEGRVKL